MSIPFTQFMLPDGRRGQISIDRAPETESVAASLVQKGVSFEIEILRTGDVSMEALLPITADGDQASLAIEICANGPGVPCAVDRLVANARRALSAVRGELS